MAQQKVRIKKRFTVICITATGCTYGKVNIQKFYYKWPKLCTGCILRKKPSPRQIRRC